MRFTTAGARRSARRSEFGGGGIKFLISIVILGILAQALYIGIPIYIAVYDFTTQLDKEAQFGATKPAEQIKDGLVKYGQELKLPVDEASIKVDKSKSELKVTADFTVPVETLLYTYNWVVHAEKAYPLF